MSASPKLKISWLGARGSNKRIEGESVNTFRPLPQSLMYSASQKYPLHSRHLTLILKGNPMWYIEPKLVTLQGLVGLQDPQTCGTTRDPHQPCLISQRDMPSKYGLKLRWDLDTSYLQRTTPAPRISPSRF